MIRQNVFDTPYTYTLQVHDMVRDKLNDMPLNGDIEEPLPKRARTETEEDRYAFFKDGGREAGEDEVQDYLDEPLGAYNGQPLMWWSDRVSKA